ncbi:hypothetical protein PFISCL1PPCAC_22713, partial [Pristionchus fissidentatus]
GAFHRNFRCQGCLSISVYCLGICARFVLIYYQVYDIPLTDDDSKLLVAELLRDFVIGYTCGLYEKNSLSTISVLILSEIVNSSLAFFNAAIWLCVFLLVFGAVVRLFIAISCVPIYMVIVCVPTTFVALPCFICFGYNTYGPPEWILSRSMAFALWDLFFVVCFPHFPFPIASDIGSLIMSASLSRMCHHFVRINSTIVAEAPLVFHSILAGEVRSICI